jgi:hypothetical protein
MRKNQRWLAPFLSLIVLLGMSTVAVQPASALPAGCHNSDAFGPSLRSMKHFIYCKTGRAATVLIVREENRTTMSATTTTRVPYRVGGPSCTWQIHNWAKRCYQRGVAHFICLYWMAAQTIHHCLSVDWMANPPDHVSLGFTLKAFSHGLWRNVKSTFHNHVLRRCLVGTSGGATAAIILKTATGVAATTGPVGILATAAGGCVAGALSYWFH